MKKRSVTISSLMPKFDPLQELRNFCRFSIGGVRMRSDGVVESIGLNDSERSFLQDGIDELICMAMQKKGVFHMNDIFGLIICAICQVMEHRYDAQLHQTNAIVSTIHTIQRVVGDIEKEASTLRAKTWQAGLSKHDLHGKTSNPTADDRTPCKLSEVLNSSLKRCNDLAVNHGVDSFVSVEELHFALMGVQLELAAGLILFDRLQVEQSSAMAFPMLRGASCADHILHSHKMGELAHVAHVATHVIGKPHLPTVTVPLAARQSVADVSTQASETGSKT